MEEIETSLQQIERKDDTYDSLRLHIFDCPNLTKTINFKEWICCVKSYTVCGKYKYTQYDRKMNIKDTKE